MDWYWYPIWVFGIVAFWCMVSGFLGQYVNRVLDDNDRRLFKGSYEAESRHWNKDPLIAIFIIVWPVAMFVYPFVIGVILLAMGCFALPKKLASALYNKRHMAELVQKELANEGGGAGSQGFGTSVNHGTASNFWSTPTHLEFLNHGQTVYRQTVYRTVINPGSSPNTVVFGVPMMVDGVIVS